MSDVVPAPTAVVSYLAVLRSATSAQPAPFHSSVFSVLPGASQPPKAKVAVEIPDPAIFDLAVFKSLTSVQLVPFQLSVIAVYPGK